MKIKYIMLLIGSLIVCLFGGTIYALSETFVVNHLDTGVVDIRLVEFEKRQDGSEAAFSGRKTILPGMNLSLIPKVYNDGASCYVRAHLEFKDIDGLKDQCFIGLNENWVKCMDGYYYYKDVLNPADEIKLFDGIHFPTDLSDEMQNKEFDLNIRLDAVQSLHFYPDYERDNPWGDVKILKCIQSGPYDIRVMESDNLGLQVVYQGDSKSLIAAPDDFFAGFGVMMPGDTYDADVKLVNNGNQGRSLYFRTESIKEHPLFDEINLEITSSTDEGIMQIYSGPLKSDTLNKNVELIYLEAGAKGNMHFKLYVPTALDNAFTLMNSDIKWIFSTTDSVKETESVKTGDYANIGLLLMVWGLSLLVSTSVLIIKKYNKHLRV